MQSLDPKQYGERDPRTQHRYINLNLVNNPEHNQWQCLWQHERLRHRLDQRLGDRLDHTKLELHHHHAKLRHELDEHVD